MSVYSIHFHDKYERIFKISLKICFLVPLEKKIS